MEDNTFSEFKPLQLSNDIIDFNPFETSLLFPEQDLLAYGLMHNLQDNQKKLNFDSVLQDYSPTVSKVIASVKPSQKKINNKEAYAMNFFIQKGLSIAQAAGIVGNLVVESMGLNTTIEGDKKTSIGIAQWHDTKPGVGRKTALFNYAKNNGLDWKDLDTQLNFLWTELKTTPRLGLAKLQKAKTAKEASFIFGCYFEGFVGYKNADGAEHKKRRDVANRLYNTYNK